MTAPPAEPAEPRHGPWFWVMVAAGAALVAFGVWGMLAHAAATMPAGWAWWFAAALLGHDLLLAPALLVAGWLVGRLPGRWRVPVRAGLIVSGVVVLVTLPALLGDGRATQPGNASLLPNRYWHSLGLVLGLVWSAVLLAVLRLTVGRQPRRHGTAA